MPSREKRKSYDIKIFGGDSQIILDELNRLIKEFCRTNKWELIQEVSNSIFFGAPKSWYQDDPDGVRLEYEFEEAKLNIKVYAENVQFLSGPKLEKNVNLIINWIGPKLQSFISDKETSRQITNLSTVNKLKATTHEIPINQTFSVKLKHIQKKIDQSQLPNILKIIGYYKEQVSNHNVLIGDLNSVDFHMVSDTEIESTKKGLEIYGSLVGLLEACIISMLTCVEKDDLIEFYEFYNNFESMGLFITTGEKTIIHGINDINNNLNSVVAGINILAQGMYNMSGQLSQMSNQLSSQLADVKSGIDVNNAIATVNAYQNYQTKRELKS